MWTDFTEFQVDGHQSTINMQIAESLDKNMEVAKYNYTQASASRRRLEYSSGVSSSVMELARRWVGQPVTPSTWQLPVAATRQHRVLRSYPERSLKEYEVAVFYYSDSGKNILTAEGLIEVATRSPACWFACALVTVTGRMLCR